MSDYHIHRQISGAIGSIISPELVTLLTLGASQDVFTLTPQMGLQTWSIKHACFGLDVSVRVSRFVRVYYSGRTTASREVTSRL